MFINCRNQYKEQTTYLPREKIELIWYRVTLNLWLDVSKSYQTVDSDPITFHPTFDMLIYIFDVGGAVKGTNTGTFLTFCLIDWNQYPLWLSCILKAVYYTATTWWQKGTMSESCLLGISMHNTVRYYIYITVNWPFRSLIIYEIHRFKKQHVSHWLVMTLTFDI